MKAEQGRKERECLNRWSDLNHFRLPLFEKKTNCSPPSSCKMVFLCDSACWRPPREHAAPLQRLPWGGEFDAGSSEDVLKKHKAVRKF